VGFLGGLGAGIATAVLLAAVYRVPGVRHAVMEFMHRITGE
jgi:hypothetical protein